MRGRRLAAGARIRGFLAALLVGVLLAFGSPSAAQASDGEFVQWQLGAATEQIVIGRVILRYDPDLETEAKWMAERIPGWWQEIEDELGHDLNDRLLIHFVDHSGGVAKATGMPQWVQGVANSRRGEIALARHGPDGAKTELGPLIRHEMGHVALHRAVEGAPIPRWFNEGVADSVADEIDLLRAETLAQAVFGAGVPELPRLERSFRDEDSRTVGVAYAASRDFATFLRYHDPDGQRFKNTLSEMRAGHGFEASVLRAYGMTLDELDEQWRSGLFGRFVWYPLVGSGTLPMMLAAPVVALAWARRRRRYKRGLARLDAEERAAQLARA